LGKRSHDTIRLTLVRHGETHQNVTHVVQGQDPNQGRLTERGMRQAALVGRALKAEPFDIVHTSTLERAVLTMSQILMAREGERALPIRFADDLREVNQGVLHGQSHDVWKASIQGDPMAWSPEGGESWLDVQARVTRYLHDVVLADGFRNILLVAHGGANRGIIASLLDIPIAQTWLPAGQGAPQGNTCVNRFVLDARGRVLAAEVNDTSHLAEEDPTAGPGQRWLLDERRWEVLGRQHESGEVAVFGTLTG
jgi:broad specificity phosphatase PhoE